MKQEAEKFIEGLHEEQESKLPEERQTVQNQICHATNCYCFFSTEKSKLFTLSTIIT